MTDPLAPMETTHPPASADPADPGLSPVCQVTRALAFAAEAHRNQRRKGAAQEPYINHLIEVMDLVSQATGGSDVELLIAALLHDVIEDTPVDAAEVTDRFGARVARIVQENSDDMSLPKDERRRARIAGMPHKSASARIVKTADVISNLRAILASPPAGWGADRKLGYLDGCRQLIDAGRGANAVLERLFDQTAQDVECAVREDAALEVEGRSVLARQLEGESGQQVFILYLPNTNARPMGDEDVSKLCSIIARSFPSGTVQRGEAIYEGRQRPILMARIRTDSTEAVVTLAQRLCHDFDERFVGVELDRRYIRIYSDDTG